MPFSSEISPQSIKLFRKPAMQEFNVIQILNCSKWMGPLVKGLSCSCSCEPNASKDRQVR